MKRDALLWVYRRSADHNPTGTLAFFLVFPKRTFLRYDSSPNERLAARVVPMVTPYHERQKDLTPGRLGLGYYFDAGPPRLSGTGRILVLPLSRNGSTASRADCDRRNLLGRWRFSVGTDGAVRSDNA